MHLKGSVAVILRIPSTSITKRIFHMKMSFAQKFIFVQMNTDKHEWFRTRTRFETEVKSNSEMAYFPTLGMNIAKVLVTFHIDYPRRIRLL